MFKDYLLVGMVSLMSIAANLPENLIGLTGLDRRLLVFGLLIVVTIALVRYSKLALILAVIILALGANLPSELAAALNIEPKVLMLALVAIVLFALTNRLLKLPSGLDRKQGFAHEGAQALFGAVMKGRTPVVSRLLEAGIDPNARSRHGYTALMMASAKGHHQIVNLLLQNGADLTMVDSHGRNALQIARESNHDPCIALLLRASKQAVKAPDAPPELLAAS